MTFTAKGRPLKRPSFSTGESMKLHWSPRSPFVRKVMVAAHELGLAEKIERVRSVAAMGKPNPAIMLDNPLSKIPALVLGDGTVLVDSAVIIEYLDSLAGGGRLLAPAGRQRWLVLSRQALADGLLDLLVLWRNEREKPAGRQTHDWLDAFAIKAAPWATQVLADLGADVIKIERPGAGDDTRAWGPPFLKGREGNATAESGYFLSVNRGKRSVAVDIATVEGQQLIRAMAQQCDVVIENFKVGTLAKYGLDAASLRRLKPSLVYCSVTGFGQDGPRSQNAAYDFAIQAMGGLMSVTGERDGEPGGGPQKVGVPVVDLMTGMYATVAILAALARRAETGQGETIDLAMLDVAAAFLANQAMNHLVSGKTPQRGGNRHPNIQPQDVFAASDGQFVLAVGNDSQFA